jgi:hypothetical protein
LFLLGQHISQSPRAGAELYPPAAGAHMRWMGRAAAQASVAGLLAVTAAALARLMSAHHITSSSISVRGSSASTPALMLVTL